LENEKLKSTITEKYMHGAFNETDIEAFRSVFHPEFSIINIQQDGSFFLFTRDMWEEVLRKRLDDEKFDYETVALQPNFKSMEVVGDKANVSLELLLGDKIIYTDFLLLSKINNEWKIVSKIYHQH